ncbi:hypothetical protein K435DRAFT_789699 [Dendrothele bispora CBS 962.96]|uniref:Uncharacterized protein n=1 Tax=Dendrothele bispora (strain CBS 962.96) TaxID=1314807 RepID=A0A4S8MSD4_DENBC|nr:hypothetical protein K435DRAFT_789699 [Dendrothele bispora CBS 962.96]
MPTSTAGHLVQHGNLLPKVRVVRQRDYHELILQQQINSELNNKVSEMVSLAEESKHEIETLQDQVSILENLRDRLSTEVVELEDSVTELQNAENPQLDHLAKANTNLSRELYRKNIEIQTLRDLVRNFTALKVTEKDSTISQENPNAEKGEDLVHAKKTSQNVSMANGGGSVSDKSSEKETLENNPFEREASVLRDIQPDMIPTCPTPFPLDALHDKQAQKWFHEAYKYVNVDLGTDYAALLIAWIDFERLNGWKQTRGGLPTRKRPQEITKWINSGRYPPRYKTPTMDETFVLDFSKEMYGWWQLLRSTRMTALNNDKTAGSWASLDKCGVNGWYSIITGLKWWGNGIPLLNGEGRKACAELWLETVKDTLSTLQALHTYRMSDQTEK